MSKIRYSGPLSMRFASFLALSRIGLAAAIRHARGQRLEPSWDANMEIGVRFWRHQFTMAMRQQNMVRGRQILDSLQTETDDHYDVLVEPCKQIEGHWYTPAARRSAATILYLHGGGYAFHGAMSRRFAAMLAHHTGARLFAPDYRLTPEHPHPAQRDDALAAWQNVAQDTPPEKVVVIGDSAGGHMALMLLQTLHAEGLSQPALCIGLCPWTDIGERGESLHANDRYDLVQGWMALKFGEWLDPGGKVGRAALSPIEQDYKGLAPIYLQAGGREILRDMIRDFAAVQVNRGADVVLDLWPDMPHDFQAFDSDRVSSVAALARICEAVSCYVDQQGCFSPGKNSVLSASVPAPRSVSN